MFYTYLSIAGQSAEEKAQEEPIVMTWHRQENTADRARMESILRLVERLVVRLQLVVLLMEVYQAWLVALVEVLLVVPEMRGYQVLVLALD